MTFTAQGSKECLAESIATSRPLVLQAVQHLIPNRQDAEDVAQDALVAALLNIHAYRGDAKLGTWLYRVGCNAALMELRRKRRVTARSARALQLLPAELNWLHGAEIEGPQNQLERQREARLLRTAVAALPVHYREVVMQCDLDEKPLPKVAARLGLSSAGVRTRRLRAIALLRAWLEHQTQGATKRHRVTG